MHCDVSQGNLMLRVVFGDVKEAVPDWPGPGHYIKRPGILSDWGLAIPYLPKDQSDGLDMLEAWGITVSFPDCFSSPTNIILSTGHISIYRHGTPFITRSRGTYSSPPSS